MYLRGIVCVCVCVCVCMCVCVWVWVCVYDITCIKMHMYTVERRLSECQSSESSIIRTSHEVADSAIFFSFFSNVYIY